MRLPTSGRGFAKVKLLNERRATKVNVRREELNGNVGWNSTGSI